MMMIIMMIIIIIIIIIIIDRFNKRNQWHMLKGKVIPQEVYIPMYRYIVNPLLCMCPTKLLISP